MSPAIASVWSEVVTWLFVIANGGRIVAYLPQIIAAWSCPRGARSVSILTWSYFAMAHLTAVLYAVFILQDLRSIWIFGGNLSVTAALVALLLWKRIQYRRGQLKAPPTLTEAANAPSFTCRADAAAASTDLIVSIPLKGEIA